MSARPILVTVLAGLLAALLLLGWGLLLSPGLAAVGWLAGLLFWLGISLGAFVLEQHQRAADHGPLAQRDHPRGDAVPLPQPLGAELLGYAHRFAAANQVAQLHGLTRHEPAHLIETDDRSAQPGNVLARGSALLPPAPAKVVVRDVAAARQVGGNQVLEGGTKKDRDGIVAEDIRDLLPFDICGRASLGTVAVQQLGQSPATLLSLGPGDQSGDVMRRGQGDRLPSGAAWSIVDPRLARAWARRHRFCSQL